MAFYEEWSENPPAHLILAAVHLKRKQTQKGDPMELLRMQQQGIA